MHLHHQLHHRLDLIGSLVLETALHIGSGDRDGTDARILRGLDGQPYIPGSSLKGVVRSRVESLSHLLGKGEPCFLIKNDEGKHFCLSTKKKGPNEIQEAARNAETLPDFIKTKLCLCCRLFGGASWRSRLSFDDLHPEDDRDVPLERRDGVGIDRDSHRAVNNVKYGFQVVPSQTRFRLHLQAENLDQDERALLILALMELVNGHIALGGKVSRGLGACRLDAERSFITETDFTNHKQVLAHFSAKSQAEPPRTLAQWLAEQGNSWLPEEALHA